MLTQNVVTDFKAGAAGDHTSDEAYEPTDSTQIHLGRVLILADKTLVLDKTYAISGGPIGQLLT